jgi:hypothetical protein
MFSVRDLIKRHKTLVIQQRESQIALNNANLNIQNKYEEIIPKGPHGTLPLSPALGPEKKLYAATYTSKPAKSILNRCIPFTDENNQQKLGKV